MSEFSLALAGNPNCGKTTLFNALTGASQRIGNWPGVTVDKVEGDYQENGNKYNVIDLPGIYSFSAYSLDEKVSREFILSEKPDVVVNIIDASNLERNLYLTTQLLEMKVPVIVALNMMDIVKQRKIKIEIEHLSKHLDCKVIPISASGKTGIDTLKEEIAIAVSAKKISSTVIKYDEVMETSIKKVEAAISADAKAAVVDARWLAVKLFEEDELAKEIASNAGELIAEESVKIEKHIGEDADIVVADGRYGFIHGLAKDVINRTSELDQNITDKIDSVILNRILGIPIFLGIMYLMFLITMNAGAPFIDFFDGLCGTIFVDGVKYLIEGWMPAFLTTIIADGVGGGIQTVATFIPPIGLIFLCLSTLEDSGYMARAAFVMDRALRSIGLPGKAFIPMLVGLGCNVPGIMATRTLESNRDRLLSIMINPLISCGARLPIWVLFAAVFFRDSAGTMLFSLYFIGVTLAVIMGLLFGKTILKGEASNFVMELPPYHIPTLSGVFFHTWNRLKSFILRAGKVLIIVVVILSFLNSIGTDGSFGNEDSENSVLSAASKAITPVFYPMGLTEENWPASVGLFTGLFAKEAVVGTLDSLYSQIAEKDAKAAAKLAGKEIKEKKKEEFDFWKGIGDSFAAIPAGYEGFFDGALDPLGLGDVTGIKDQSSAESAEGLEINEGTFSAMKKYFPNRYAAIAYILFLLIYAPCFAAIAAVYKETNLKWTIFSTGYLTGLAWIVSTLFYQSTRLASNAASALGWITFCVAIIITFVFTLKKMGKQVED